ncbi:hypothetical protein LPJ55_000808 [Coemansia sp. RSA 990]|nr:hypothetical protein LPJ55_000808 [Coemansia sp. RSA 990]
MQAPKALFKLGQIPFTRDSVLLLGVTGAGCLYGTYVMFSKFQEPGYLRRRPRFAYKNEMSEFPHSITLTVPFGDSKLAQIAKESLQVDSELSSDKVNRTISVEGANLIVTYTATTLRMLRVSVNGFMDSLILVSRTLEAFA